MRTSGRTALARWLRPAAGAVGAASLLQLAATFLFVVFAWTFSMGAAELLQGRLASSWFVAGAAAAAGRAAGLWLADGLLATAGRTLVAAARREIAETAAVSGAGFLMGAEAGARTSQIMDRTARLAGWASRWTPGTRIAVGAPLVLLAATATQSWLCAAALAISALLLPVFLWFTLSETQATARAQQAALDALAGAFQTRAEHAGVLRAFRAVTRETQVLREAALDLKRRTLRILRIAFLSGAVLDFFSAISIAVLAVYIGFQLLGLFPFATGETVTFREGLMVLMLAPEFFAPIRRMASLHHDRADAVSAADMLAAWIEAAPPSPPRLARLPSAPRLEYRGVALHRSGAIAVSGVVFTAQPGEIVALVGPSGSGKTSCLLALLGHAEIAEGEIRIDDAALPAGASLADSVAYLRQSPWLVEGSLADNLRLGAPDARDEDLHRALAQVGASSLADDHPAGLRRPLGRGGAGLSGGERQRLSLARAILREAPLWLLDEPTAHLDAAAESNMLMLLRRLAAGRTILLATHRPAAIAAADHIVHLPPDQRGEAAA